MTKRIIRTKTTQRKNGTARTLPYTRSKKAQKQAKKAADAPDEPSFRSLVHDAMAALDQARRAHDNVTVFRFRGKHDFAQLEHVIYLEGIERAYGHLVTLDLELPEGGAS